MKILFVLDDIQAWRHGIWWHRQMLPAEALSLRGHAVRQTAMGVTFSKELMEWPDTVIFGRVYASHFEPVRVMNEYKKLGKRVLYDMDDDFWQVAKDNPSVNVSNAMKDQYEGMIRVADAVITPSPVLAKKFKKYFKKPIFICPNGVNPKVYQLRSKESKELVIGYMGAASHWKDLKLIGDVISKLAEKYSFTFMIYGLVGEALEAAMYSYRRQLSDNLMPEKNAYFRSAIEWYDQISGVRTLHVPFMPPELHPTVLRKCDFDIGLAPLEDTTFNHGKSNVKFYEYASVGTATLASKVLPYTEEVDYLAKNTFKDWYAKLERLIVDKEFREKLAAKQHKWVVEHRYPEQIGLIWEMACQRPGGLKILNQS